MPGGGGLGGGWKRDGDMSIVDVQRDRLPDFHTGYSDLRIEHDQADRGADKDEVLNYPEGNTGSVFVQGAFR